MSDKNTMSMIDKVLIEMKNGNIDNFEILYELTSKPLLALCYSYTKNVNNMPSYEDLFFAAEAQARKEKLHLFSFSPLAFSGMVHSPLICAMCRMYINSV